MESYLPEMSWQIPNGFDKFIVKCDGIPSDNDMGCLSYTLTIVF